MQLLVIGSIVFAIIVVMIIFFVVLLRPLYGIDNPNITRVPVVPERADARCGPNFAGASCGPARCCSTSGWCGSAGEPHCTKLNNVPAFNGLGAVIV